MAFDDPTIDLTLEGSPGLEPTYPSPAVGKETEKTGKEVVTELREIRRALEAGRGSIKASAAEMAALGEVTYSEKTGRFHLRGPGISRFLSQEDAQIIMEEQQRARAEKERAEAQKRFSLPLEPAGREGPEPERPRLPELEALRQAYLTGPRRLIRGVPISAQVRPDDAARFEPQEPDTPDALQDLADAENKYERRGWFKVGGGERGFQFGTQRERSAIREESDVSGPGDRGGGDRGGDGGRDRGGGDAGGDGGGGRFQAPRVASGLASMVTGSVGAGHFAAGLASALGGGAGAIAAGTAAGFGVTAAGYEVAPHLQAFLRRRSQFREEFIESEALAARTRALRGEGLPRFTMFGAAPLEFPKIESELMQDMLNQGRTKTPVRADDTESNILLNRLDAIQKEKEALSERIRFLENSGMGSWNDADQTQRFLRDQMRRLETEEIRRREQLAKRPEAERQGGLRFNRTPGFNPADPERSVLSDNVNYVPEDFRAGELLAPLLASLRQEGFDTTKGPPKFPDELMKYHRPPTPEEQRFRSATEREKRLFNTPLDTDYNIEQDWDAFQQRMLQLPPDREVFGDTIVDSTPVFRTVGSPYGGMSA